MLVLEFKARTNCQKASAIDEAIRTAQFIRNKSLRLWMDVRGTSKYDLQKYCKILAKDFPFARVVRDLTTGYLWQHLSSKRAQEK